MSRFAALGNKHLTAQREYSYESYIDDTMNVEVTDAGCMSLDEFKWKSPPVVVPPTRSRVYAYNYTVEASAITMQYPPVIPDPTKSFILSLITGVERLIDDGFCYASFTSQNIWVTKEGRALLKHVEIVALSEPAKWEAYKSIGRVITDLFSEYDTPEDVLHLINLLNSGRKHVLYKIHPSLVPHSDRGWVYMKAYEYLIHRVGSVHQSLIFLSLPYLDTWRSIVQLNNILVETYDFCPDSYNEAPPLDNNGNPTWSEREKNLQSAKRFLDFHRNGTSHRLHRDIKITADQYETILLVLFQMLLPKLIELMFDHLGVEGLEAAGLLRFEL